MCDFRGPPTGLYEFATSKQIDFKYQGNYSKESFKNEAGIYGIPATGSYYAYYDGELWWRNREDWGPPSKDCWQETGGYPSQWTKYVFLYPPVEHGYGWFGGIPDKNVRIKKEWLAKIYPDATGV